MSCEILEFLFYSSALLMSMHRYCYYFTWGSPKNRNFFAWKYVWNEFKKKEIFIPL